MTGIRQSAVFVKETSFKEKPNSPVWVQFPPNSYFSATPSQSVTRMQSMGSKFADGFFYGAFSGTWDLSFMLDYHYLEPLTLVFEKYMHNSITGGNYEHVFEKSSALRVPSFTVRQKVMNQMAGGPANSDVLREIFGCVCTDFSMARSASSSQYQVTMSGFYADERLVEGTLLSTDYKDMAPELVEYACMTIGDTPGAAISDCTYVADTMSVSLGVKNNAEAIYATCTSKPTQYSEGLSDFTFATTCYSNDPRKYQLRMYSGGYDNFSGSGAGVQFKPLNKGRKPMQMIHVTSFTSELPNTTDSVAQRIASAYASSARTVDIALTEVPIRSVPWVKGDGSKLQDSISGSECKTFKITVHTSESTFDTTDSSVYKYGSGAHPHVVDSADPAANYPVATFNANGGTGTMASINGPIITMPACTFERTGYACSQWVLDSEKGQVSPTLYPAGDSYEILSNTAYAAWWVAINYTITLYNVDDVTWASGYNVPTRYTYAETVTLPTSANMTKTSGGVTYTFGGWYTDSTFSGQPVSTIPAGSTGAKIFYAKWTAPANEGDE